VLLEFEGESAVLATRLLYGKVRASAKFGIERPMKSSSPMPLSLAEFDISPERGFLPLADPIDHLADEVILSRIGEDLPKLLTARQLRRLIQDRKDIMGPVGDDWGLDKFRWAMRTLSFAAHAYVWEDPDHPAGILPPVLACPWYEVARQLGRPPVLSYASYALQNWRRLDSHRPIELGNIVLQQNFLGGLDEEWFVLIHIEIEAEAGAGLAGLVRAHNAARENKLDDVLEGLAVLARAQEAMRETLLRMPERCDPYIYYSRVRPYIHGWKNSPALPDGLVYEGVAAYQEKPQLFRGETGAQSSIVPALDAGLGIRHADDPLTQYLMEMRDYMPPRHRAFITALEQQVDEQRRPRLYGYIHDRRLKHPELWKAYCACVDLLGQFREIHVGYAERYIFRQHQSHASNPTAVGTGGTPFMTYLTKHLEETKQIIQD
jgi:indoleamine 2,3-dioxygenase